MTAKHIVVHFATKHAPAVKKMFTNHNIRFL